MARLRDMKQIREALAAQGFAVERVRNGHYRVIAPTGAKVQIAATPSDHRAVLNSVTRLRRIGFQA
jgi:hypothetical protein